MRFGVKNTVLGSMCKKMWVTAYAVLTCTCGWDCFWDLCFYTEQELIWLVATTLLLTIQQRCDSEKVDVSVHRMPSSHQNTSCQISFHSVPSTQPLKYSSPHVQFHWFHSLFSCYLIGWRLLPRCYIFFLIFWGSNCDTRNPQFGLSKSDIQSTVRMLPLHMCEREAAC